MADKIKDTFKKSTATTTDQFINIMNKIEKQPQEQLAIEKKSQDTDIYDNLAEIEPGIDEELEDFGNNHLLKK